mgnify:CR=1 FL=1
MPLRDIAFVLVLGGGVLATFVRAYIGLCLWIVLTYAAPQQALWGFAGNLSPVMMVAVATLAAMVLQNAGRLPPLRAPGVLLLLLLLWTGLTTLFAVDRSLAISEYIEFLKIVTLAVVTAMLVRDHRTFLIVVSCFAASIVFFGVKGGLFVLATGGASRVWGPPETFMGANNALGVALTMMIPFAWFLAKEAPSKWLARGWLASIPLCAMSVLATYSRGAALALGCMVVFWLVISGRKLIAMLIVGLALIAVAVVMPEKFFERMETITNYEADGSAMSRLEMWGFGWNVALSKPFGGGFGIFLQEHLYDDYGVDLTVIDKETSAHSIYFEVLGQHGFIGFALFLSIGIALFVLCWRAKRQQAGTTLSRFAHATQISLVGYALGGAFVNKAFEWPMTFQILALMLAALAIYGRQFEKVSGEFEPSNSHAGKRSRRHDQRIGAAARERARAR